MLPSRKLLLILAIVLCLLAADLAQPVNAGRSAQTVPTAGPRPTQDVASTPQEGSNPGQPAPTAVLATSPVTGLQPSPSASPTPTRTVKAPPAGLSNAAATATAAPQSPSETPGAISTKLPAASESGPSGQNVLPTLPTAVAGEETAQAAVWCYPVFALILAGLVLLISKWMRSRGPKPG